MEILKSEGQLGKGTRMFRINRMFDTVEEYEYLCTHPHNERYAIVIDTMTKDPKKIYKDDPIFATSKVVVSFYGDTPTETFAPNFKDSVRMAALSEEDLAPLDGADGIKLAQTALRYADGIILGAADVAPELVAACREASLPVLPFDADRLSDGSYVDDYNRFYDQL